MLTVTGLKWCAWIPGAFAKQLAEKKEQAPNFFSDTPVVDQPGKLDAQ